MNQNSLSPDDPKLTAYALGELDLEESARVADSIKGDVVAQAAVEEIRSWAGQLEAALENEPIPSILGRDDHVSANAEPKRIPLFPLRAYWIGGLAAACVVAVVATQPRGGSRVEADQASGSQAHLMHRGQSDVLASDAVSDLNIRLRSLPVVDSRKRAHPSESSDVSPAPLQDDGLQRWGSVADNRSGPASAMGSSDSSQEATFVDSPKYQPNNYKTIDKTNTIEVAALSEDIPVSTVEATRTPEEDSLNSVITETPLLAASEPHHPELLARTIRYKMPSVDLSQWYDLSQIDTATKITLIDQKVKLALGAAGPGNQVQEAPTKSSTYDEILSWAEENQDPAEDSAESRRPSIDAVKKPKRATVE